MRDKTAPMEEAFQGFNDVRLRTGLVPLSEITLSNYDEFITALLEERGREFFNKCFKKIDQI